MTRVTDAIRRGHYAAKQIHCSDPLIAWSHSRRFQIALELAAQYLSPGARILDHGSGDGTFLAMLAESGPGGFTAIGSELTPQVVQDCRSRFQGVEGIAFLLRDELFGSEHQGAYDLVTCMEVLEHVYEVDSEIELLSRLLKPGGVLVVSVPVETGLPLLVKQVVRKIAGWRGLGDYPGDNPYTFSELAVSVLAGPQQHITRPEFRSGDEPPHYSHKGFNWMVLRRRLANHLVVERVLASPLRWLPPHLNSQAWFVARKDTQT